MLRDLTAGSLFASALLLRQADSRFFLFVEGPDEDLIFDRHLDRTQAYLIPGGGRNNVLGVAELLDSQRFENACGLIDSDLDALNADQGTYPSSIVRTSHYDLVSDLIAARPELIRHACRMLAKDAVDAVEAEIGQPFHELLLAAGGRILALRQANLSTNCALPVGKLASADPFTADYGVLSLPALVSRLLESSKTGEGAEGLISAAEQAADDISRLGLVAGGHDILKAAATVLRKTKLVTVGERALARAIFTAVDCSWLKELIIYGLLEAKAQEFERRLFLCPS